MEPSCLPPRIVSIEGGIGAGKSTLLAILEAQGYTTLPEPIEQWTRGENMLKQMYTNPQRYMFTFQMLVLTSLAKALQSLLRQGGQHKDGVIFVERSLPSSRHVFGKLASEKGHMSPSESAIYEAAYELMLDDELLPRSIVYLQPPLETVFQRLKHRDREGEAALPFSLMLEVQTKHDEWLLHGPERSLPCVIAMCDNTAEEVASMLERLGLDETRTMQATMQTNADDEPADNEGYVCITHHTHEMTKLQYTGFV